MSLRDCIGNAISSGFECLASNLGTEADYSHRSDMADTIYVIPGEESKVEEEVMGVLTEIITKKFMAPRQTNFPPTNGVSINDELIVGSKKWYIHSFTNDSLETNWTLNCRHYLAKVV